MFDGQNGSQKQNVDTMVLTDLARQGIFRFFPGVNNGNADATVSGTGNTRVAPVVDKLGNPLDPETTLGPLVTSRAANFVRNQINEAVRDGARALIDALR